MSERGEGDYLLADLFQISLSSDWEREREWDGGFIRPRRPLSPISHEESDELELELFLEICWRLVGNCRDLQRVLLLCHPTRMLDFIA